MTFTLTTSVTGIGTLTGAGTYKYVDPVTVTAAAANGWSFQQFGGDCSGNTCSLTMDANHSFSATFVPAQFAFNLSFLGDGGGTVTEDGVKYAANTSFF